MLKRFPIGIQPLVIGMLILALVGCAAPTPTLAPTVENTQPAAATSVPTMAEAATAEPTTAATAAATAAATEPAAAATDAAATDAAATDAAPVSEVTLINPTGPAVIPVAGLDSGKVALPEGAPAVKIQYWKTVDEAVGLLAGDAVQFAVLPVTMAANLSASGVDLVLLGVHEWKVFYLVAAPGKEFKDWSSLKGQTLYTPEGKGQTVDVLTRYALQKNDIQPDKDVTFAYAPTQEIVALFKEGKVDYAALPEPFVTQALAANPGSQIVLDYQEYWAKETGAQNGLPIAGLFVKRGFAQSHPQATQQVVQALIDSTEWSSANPADAIAASAKALPLPAPVLTKALERIKFAYVDAAGSKSEVLDFLTTIQTTYPEGVKKMPGDSFFQP
jgi:NitT/TauT family transport system substrate-binding protein